MVIEKNTFKINVFLIVIICSVILLALNARGFTYCSVFVLLPKTFTRIFKFIYILEMAKHTSEVLCSPNISCFLCLGCDTHHITMHHLLVAHTGHTT